MVRAPRTPAAPWAWHAAAVLCLSLAIAAAAEEAPPAELRDGLGGGACLGDEASEECGLSLRQLRGQKISEVRYGDLQPDGDGSALPEPEKEPDTDKVPAAADGSAPLVVPLPSGGRVELSSRGAYAFRVRLLPGDGANGTDPPAIDTPMVHRLRPDIPFVPIADGADPTRFVGIRCSFGALLVTDNGTLQLLGASGNLVTESEPLAPAEGRLVLSTNNSELYGRGAGTSDARRLTTGRETVGARVSNRATYTPYYYSTDGYGALGVVRDSSWDRLPVSYSSDGRQITWTFSGGPFEMLFMPAQSLTSGTIAYYQLTGTPAMPPRYAFGFGASRRGWKDKDYIEDVVRKFRKDEFPIDYVTLDFEESGDESSDSDFDMEAGEPEYQDFGFNQGTFPHPQQQLAEYQEKWDIKIAGLHKPRLGNSELLRTAREKGWVVPASEPGPGYPPDLAGAYALGRNLNFTKPEVRAWYSDQVKHYFKDGVSFWWNNGAVYDYYGFYYWNVALSEARHDVNPKARSFTLNSGFSPGMARLGGAVWTGDIDASWSELENTPGMMLNWVLAGAPYVGCDIGGSEGNTSGDLLTRWMQVGTFMPIMRVNSVIDATPHFPWLFGDEAAAAMQKTLDLRYRLIPYHYSLAHAFYSTSSLWTRPLLVAFPEDEAAANITSQWMDGSILVAPVLRNDSQRRVYLPSGTWYSLAVAPVSTSSKIYQGPTTLDGAAALDEIPAFVRAGTVLPLAPVIQNAEQLPGGPLEVQVYAGADGYFELVEDDGHSLAYTTGQVRKTMFKWDDASKKLTWSVTGDTDAGGKHAFQKVFMTVIDEHGSQPSFTVPLGKRGGLMSTPSMPQPT